MSSHGKKQYTLFFEELQPSACCLLRTSDLSCEFSPRSQPATVVVLPAINQAVGCCGSMMLRDQIQSRASRQPRSCSEKARRASEDVTTPRTAPCSFGAAQVSNDRKGKMARCTCASFHDSHLCEVKDVNTAQVGRVLTRLFHADYWIDGQLLPGTETNLAPATIACSSAHAANPVERTRKATYTHPKNSSGAGPAATALPLR